jgi:hypothetical protein
MLGRNMQGELLGSRAVVDDGRVESRAGTAVALAAGGVWSM